MFTMLDKLELRLSDNREYLLGNQFTEADVRLFVTLIRFDPLIMAYSNVIAISCASSAIYMPI